MRSICVGRLDLDAAVAERQVATGQLSGTASSASKIRWVTSSTSPMPSTSTSRPRLAVDLDQRLGLLGVDLLAAPDDVLGVVGATLGLGALRAAAATISSPVDGEHDDRVERGGR